MGHMIYQERYYLFIYYNQQKINPSWNEYTCHIYKTCLGHINSNFIFEVYIEGELFHVFHPSTLV